MNIKPPRQFVAITLLATAVCILAGGCAGQHRGTQACRSDRRPSAQPWHLPYGYHETCWRPWPWDGSPCPPEPVLVEQIDVGSSSETEYLPVPDPSRLPKSGTSGPSSARPGPFQTPLQPQPGQLQPEQGSSSSRRTFAPRSEVVGVSLLLLPDAPTTYPRTRDHQSSASGTARPRHFPAEADTFAAEVAPLPPLPAGG